VAQRGKSGNKTDYKIMPG